MQISSSLFCLPSLVKETSRCLNFSNCFSGAPPNWKEHCCVCLDRHMVFVLVVLIFIPAAQHASENLSRDWWRSFWVKSISTKSFANHRHCTVQSLIFTPPQDSLFVTFKCIEIRKRIGERTALLWSTLTLIGLVVVLLTQTQTSECLYSDLLAADNWPSMLYYNTTVQSLSLGMRLHVFSRSTKHALTSFAYSHDFSKIYCKSKIWSIALRPGQWLHIH